MHDRARTLSIGVPASPDPSTRRHRDVRPGTVALSLASGLVAMRAHGCRAVVTARVSPAIAAQV